MSSFEELIQKKEPPEEKELEENQASEKIPVLHTLQSDIENLAKEKNRSLASVVAEEFRKKRYGLNQKTNWSRFFILSALIILFLGGGVFAGFKIYDYFCCPPDVLPPILRPAEPLVLPDNTKERIIISAERPKFISKIKEILNSQFPPETITYFPLAQKINGEKIKNLTGNKFLEILQAVPPFNLTNALAEEFNLVVYANHSGINDIVLLFNTNSPENAFSGMLSWEKNILSDLNSIFPERELISTSTTPNLDSEPKSGLESDNLNNESLKKNGEEPEKTAAGFKDKIIKNQNVRIFADSHGNRPLLYGFFDKILIITSSEPAIEAIINRFLL